MRRLTLLPVAALVALAAPASAFAHGDQVPIDRLAGTRRFEVAPIVVSLLVLALYAQAWL